MRGSGTLGNSECRAHLLGAFKHRTYDNLKKFGQKIVENPVHRGVTTCERKMKREATTKGKFAKTLHIRLRIWAWETLIFKKRYLCKNIVALNR